MLTDDWNCILSLAQSIFFWYVNRSQQSLYERQNEYDFSTTCTFVVSQYLSSDNFLLLSPHDGKFLKITLKTVKVTETGTKFWVHKTTLIPLCQYVVF